MFKSLCKCRAVTCLSASNACWLIFNREQGRHLGLLGPPLDSMCSEDAQFGYNMILYHISMNHAWYNPSGRGQDVCYGPYPSRYILPPPFASHRYMGFANDLEMHGQHSAMGHGPMLIHLSLSEAHIWQNIAITVVARTRLLGHINQATIQHHPMLRPAQVLFQTAPNAWLSHIGMSYWMRLTSRQETLLMAETDEWVCIDVSLVFSCWYDFESGWCPFMPMTVLSLGDVSCEPCGLNLLCICFIVTILPFSMPILSS